MNMNKTECENEQKIVALIKHRYPWIAADELMHALAADISLSFGAAQKGAQPPQADNTGSPKLPLLEQAFRDGFLAGRMCVSADLAWSEWQLRAGA